MRSVYPILASSHAAKMLRGDTFRSALVSCCFFFVIGSICSDSTVSVTATSSTNVKFVPCTSIDVDWYEKQGVPPGVATTLASNTWAFAAIFEFALYAMTLRVRMLFTASHLYSM